MLKDLLVASFLLVQLAFSLTHAEMEKRQVGVLARTGVLPQGKRSVQALARDGELPGKRTKASLEQRMINLMNWLEEREAALELERELQHEISKRNMEAMARAGYLVKPATESPPILDLFDSDEFLGKTDSDSLDENETSFDAIGSSSKRGGFASLARNGYIGKRDFNDEHISDYDSKRSVGAAKNFKRHIASAKSFLSRDGKRNIGSFMNMRDGKRHVGAALNFASGKRALDDDELIDELYEKRNLGSARRFTGKRNLGAARNFLTNDIKRNIGAARNFFSMGGNKKNVGAARNYWYGKRSVASLARDGGFAHLKSNGRDIDYPWDDDEDFDFDDFHEDPEKRNHFRSSQGKRYTDFQEFHENPEKKNLASFRSSQGKRYSDVDVDDFHEDPEKRSLAALKSLQGKRYPDFDGFHEDPEKRNLASFRSSQGKRYTDFDDFNEDTDKRNIASFKSSLGKRYSDFDDFHEDPEKRNLASFRSSQGKRYSDFDDFHEDTDKRNIASFKSSLGKRYSDFDDFHEDPEKRNLASLKSLQGKRYLGSLRSGKRNVAAFKNFGKRLDPDPLALASLLSNASDEDVDDILGKESDDPSYIEKREVKDDGEKKKQGSTRRKRSAEFVLPTIDLSDLALQDYEDYAEEFVPNNIQKRFLGMESNLADITNISKRHIGALARSGLLPSFRSTRYSRSGRAIIDDGIVSFRETPAAWTCAAEGSSAITSRAPSTAVAAKLALRRSIPIYGGTRHPMSFFRSPN